VRLGLGGPRWAAVGRRGAGKGDELRKAAYDALAALPLDFVGNVEGRDVPHGGRPTSWSRRLHRQRPRQGARGAAHDALETLLAALTSTPERAAAAEALLPALTDATAHMSPEQLGGAVLLGRRRRRRGRPRRQHAAGSGRAAAHRRAGRREGWCPGSPRRCRRCTTGPGCWRRTPFAPAAPGTVVV
jgi:hypothetical protein